MNDLLAFLAVVFAAVTVFFLRAWFLTWSMRKMGHTDWSYWKDGDT